MKYQDKKSKLMKTLYKTLLFSVAVLILGTSGACKGLAQEDSQPAAVMGDTHLMEAQIGQVKVTGRHLQGCSFTFPNVMAMEGLTNWQGNIVFSVNTETGNGKDKILKAFTMNVDGAKSGQTELEPATHIFDNGVLRPKENTIDSYFWPSTDGTYLYFGTVHGFTDYKDNTLGPVNDLYGAVRLAIDPANKATGPANVASTTPLTAMGTGIVTQDTEAVSIISRVRRYELKVGDVLPILRTEDRTNAAGQRETWYIVEIDGAAYGHSGKDRLELSASLFSPQP